MSDTHKTVLISLVGTTPAVLTETVWALAIQEEPLVPDRIIALTSAPGSALLRKQLFEDGHWERMKKALQERGTPLEGKLRFGNTGDSIRVFPSRCGERELDDVRSEEDNEAVADFFMELIRGFTSDDTTDLIVSIAGGRKTTSALLHSVMTLLGRAQDRINHILIDDPWITQQGFLYPGCSGEFIDSKTGQPLSSRDAELLLVDVPFVPLRYLFKQDLQAAAGNFVELMNRLRIRSANVNEDLSIALDPAKGSLRVNGEAVSLSDREYLFYLAFARRAKLGKPPLKAFPEIETDMRSTREHYLAPEKFGHWSYEALDRFDAEEDPRRLASAIRVKLGDCGFAEGQVARLVPRRGGLAIELPPESIEIL